MIYITGDTHGDIDIHKLSSRQFKEGKNLKRSDYVIICGDFGLIWDDSEEEHHWLNWLDQKPWTTLWIDGNHENFDMLKEYPVEEWHGGTVQKITENIIHLCRGNVFDIEGLKFFAFGGAESHDKSFRVFGKTVWKEELPSFEEMEKGVNSLKAVDWKVDIVITHCLPQHIQDNIFGKFGGFCRNDLTEYFDEIDKRLDFRYWFTGHYHESSNYDDKHFLIYNNIIKLTDEGFERVL